VKIYLEAFVIVYLLYLRTSPI